MYEMTDPWSSSLSQVNILKFINKSLAQQHRFKNSLDIGCGEGLFTEVLAQYSDHYTGADISQKSLERAKLRNIKIQNVELIKKDFDQLESLNKKYDLIIFNFILDYLGFQKHPKNFSQKLFILLKTVVIENTQILIINPVYQDEDFEKLNQYIYLFNNFGFKVESQEIIQENTFRIVCLVLKPHKI